jgi:Kelch motif
VEKYQIKEDKWTVMAPMKDKRHYLSACSIGDEFIYAFGGFYGSTEQEINDSIEMYEVEKNIWTPVAIRMKVNIAFLLVRIHFGLVVLFRSLPMKSYSLEGKTLIEMERFTCSTCKRRLGSNFTA